MSSFVCRISFKSARVCGCCCEMFRELTLLVHSVFNFGALPNILHYITCSFDLLGLMLVSPVTSAHSSPQEKPFVTASAEFIPAIQCILFSITSSNDAYHSYITFPHVDPVREYMCLHTVHSK